MRYQRFLSIGQNFQYYCTHRNVKSRSGAWSMRACNSELCQMTITSASPLQGTWTMIYCSTMTFNNTAIKDSRTGLSNFSHESIDPFRGICTSDLAKSKNKPFIGWSFGSVLSIDWSEQTSTVWANRSWSNWLMTKDSLLEGTSLQNTVSWWDSNGLSTDDYSPWSTCNVWEQSTHLFYSILHWNFRCSTAPPPG